MSKAAQVGESAGVLEIHHIVSFQMTVTSSCYYKQWLKQLFSVSLLQIVDSDTWRPLTGCYLGPIPVPLGCCLWHCHLTLSLPARI